MNPPRPDYAAIAALAVCIHALPAAAVQAPDAPLPATNLTPFTAVVGVPALRSAAFEPGLTWRLDAALASHSAIDSGDDGAAWLDGETLRVTLEARWSIAPRWQVGLIAPWMQHGPGLLDPVIDRWHALTGLADGQRDRQPENAIRFQYEDAGSRYELARRVSGPGDLRLELLRSLGQPGCAPPSCPRAVAAALRVGIEMDTGDPARLTGNGAVDYSADLLVGGQRTLWDRDLGWHAQIGAVFPGRGELLADAAEDVVAVAAAGLVWRWRPAVRLHAQVAASSGFWRSAVGELGGNAAELTAGLSWRTARGSWHFAVSEDLAIDRSPDVVLRLGWRSQPDSP